MTFSDYVAESMAAFSNGTSMTRTTPGVGGVAVQPVGGHPDLPIGGQRGVPHWRARAGELTVESATDSHRREETKLFSKLLLAD